MESINKRLQFDDNNDLVMKVEKLIKCGVKKIYCKEVTDYIINEFGINGSSLFDSAPDVIINVCDDETGFRKFEIAYEAKSSKDSLSYVEKVIPNGIVEFTLKQQFSRLTQNNGYIHTCTGYHQMFDLGSRPCIKETITDEVDGMSYLMEAKYDDDLIEYRYCEKSNDVNGFLDEVLSVVDSKTIIKKSIHNNDVIYSKAKLGKKNNLPTADIGVIHLYTFIDPLKFETITELEYNELINKVAESRYLMSDIDEVRNGESR